MTSLRPLLCAVLLAVIAGCSLPAPRIDPPGVELRAVAAEQLAISGQVFRVYLRLTNPNDRALKMRSARVRLYLEGIDFGEGVTTAPLNLPAGGATEVSVLFSTDMLARLPQVLSWLASGDEALDYRLSGNMALGGTGLMRINIDEAGTVLLSGPNRRSTERTI